jgi:hypothetical protein
MIRSTYSRTAATWDRIASDFRSMLASTESARAYQELRYRYTCELARQIVGHGDWRTVVYGVWLIGHERPVYIGQTCEGARRLWDLPIGESHHLGFTFLPETWERVAVLDLRSIVQNALIQHSVSIAGVAQTLNISAEEAGQVAGLALELEIQRLEEPIFNLYQKKRNGAWRKVDLKDGNSRAKRAAPLLTDLLTEALDHWRELRVAAIEDEESLVLAAGHVVFPQRILERVLREAAAEPAHAATRLDGSRPPPERSTPGGRSAT